MDILFNKRCFRFNRISLPVVTTLAIMMVFTVSCKRENLDDCYTNTGEVTTETRQATYFKKIELYDNVNLVIEPGDGHSLRVEAGKNILSSIKTEIVDSVLVITNTMKCNWVRNYNHEMTVYVSSNNLNSIRYEGSGDITTAETYEFDSLEINVWGGAGSVNMDVKCNRIDLGLHYGTVDFNVTGTSQMTTIYSNSYGPFHCGGLKSDIVYIRSNSTNDCYVNAKYILGAEITSIGNIYYSGDPYELNCNISGSGKLIKID